MKKMILPLILLTSSMSFATGGFRSVGKDLHCSAEVVAENKPFACDYPGGLCGGIDASVLVTFNSLKGDLTSGLKGQTQAISIEPYVNGPSQNELISLVKELNPVVSVAYQNKILAMTLTTSKKSLSVKERIDMSAGQRFAHSIMVVNNVAILSTGLKVDIQLMCAAGNTGDHN